MAMSSVSPVSLSIDARTDRDPHRGRVVFPRNSMGNCLLHCFTLPMKVRPFLLHCQCHLHGSKISVGSDEAIRMMPRLRQLKEHLRPLPGFVGSGDVIVVVGGGSDGVSGSGGGSGDHLPSTSKRHSSPPVCAHQRHSQRCPEGMSWHSLHCHRCSLQYGCLKLCSR